MLLRFLLLEAILVQAIAFTPSFSRSRYSNPLQLKMMRGMIPTDLSVSDRIAPIVIDPMNTPNVDIQALEGGAFLGILLWTYISYNGLFGLAGRPADWILPSLAKLTKQDDEQWYKDFIDGFYFFCPAPLEALRVLFFMGVGFLANTACIRAFDGDSFWGWSIGICLGIPSGLINISRDKLLTREKASFQGQLDKDFQQFTRNRLEKDSASKTLTSIYKIMGAFRQDYRSYRSMDVVSDRELRKLVRRWAAMPSNTKEEFRVVRILEVSREEQEAMRVVQQRLAEEREQLFRQQRQEQEQQGTAPADAPAGVNDFSR